MADRVSRDLENREILVVEPDDKSRARISRSIRRAGARVTTAVNGREAASLACLGVYEIVVIGSILPDMTGAELVRSFRGASPWTQTLELSEAWIEIDASLKADAGGAVTREPVTEDGIVTAIRYALTPAGSRTT
jgi:CheY-like chemotaxis protein